MEELVDRLWGKVSNCNMPTAAALAQEILSALPATTTTTTTTRTRRNRNWGCQGLAGLCGSPFLQKAGREGRESDCGCQWWKGDWVGKWLRDKAQKRPSEFSNTNSNGKLTNEPFELFTFSLSVRISRFALLFGADSSGQGGWDGGDGFVGGGALKDPGKLRANVD